MNILGDLVAALLWTIGQSILHHFNKVHFRKQRDQIQELQAKIDHLIELIEPKG